MERGCIELPGRSEQQCKERYRLAQSVVELTFVFLRVTFRGSPFLRSSPVLTKDADSADSGRPLHYSKSDCRVARAPEVSGPPVQVPGCVGLELLAVCRCRLVRQVCAQSTTVI